MLEMPKPWDTCQGELVTGSVTNTKEKSMLQSTKLKGFGDLKNALTSNTDMQNLEFVQLVLSLALIQYLLTMLSFLLFGRGRVKVKRLS